MLGKVKKGCKIWFSLAVCLWACFLCFLHTCCLVTLILAAIVCVKL